MKVVGIIPARYASTRLPGKVLLDICGQPMIRRVYERAIRASCLDELIVATDDERVLQQVQGFGGTAVMTSPNHRTGTDRLAEVASTLECDIVVNIQGDEPLLDPRCVEQVVKPLLDDPSIPMVTLRTPFKTPEEAADPNCVKVVVDNREFALYFSRCPIPYARSPELAAPHYLHIGLYAYRRDFLMTYASLPSTPLEQSEALEQLRVLEHGYKIKVPLTQWDSISVDTPEDLERVRRIVEQRER
ncbi:MAG: 3-deoxy-manno-octulosonate cytidylyltransferase [Armatimonadota bacterium]